MFGIVSTGTSSIAIDLTYDLKRIDEAIKKIMGGALKPTDIIQGPEGNEGPTEVRYRAHVAFSTAADLLENLLEGAQPAQGAHLRQQRVRLQPVREVARRASSSSSRTGSARPQMRQNSSSSAADGSRHRADG